MGYLGQALSLCDSITRSVVSLATGSPSNGSSSDFPSVLGSGGTLYLFKVRISFRRGHRNRKSGSTAQARGLLFGLPASGILCSVCFVPHVSFIRVRFRARCCGWGHHVAAAPRIHRELPALGLIPRGRALDTWGVFSSSLARPAFPIGIASAESAGHRQISQRVAGANAG